MLSKQVYAVPSVCSKRRGLHEVSGSACPSIDCLALSHRDGAAVAIDLKVGWGI